MATVKFGAKQFNNPTPASWSNGIQIFTVIASVVLAWIGTANFISASLSSIIQSILGLLIGIANGLKPFLGVETSKKEIPIEQVAEMEVPKETKPILKQ